MLQVQQVLLLAQLVHKVYKDLQDQLVHKVLQAQLVLQVLTQR